MISRKVRCASVAFWKASKIFLRATTLFVFLSTACEAVGRNEPFPTAEPGKAADACRCGVSSALEAAREAGAALKTTA